MTDGDYVIRTMDQTEVDFAVNMAADEGWNPGLHDAKCFYTTDNEGFYIGLLDGKPISSLSVVRYGNSYGFLGLYIVEPEFRGRGYGLQLFNQGIRHLKGCDVGLDGVLEQEPNYEEWGFRRAYYNIRYQGKAKVNIDEPTDFRIVELSKIPFNDLDTFDQIMFRAPRRNFLSCWINQPESVALGILDHDQLAGYILLRKCRMGYKIGPLFALNEMLAEALFCAGCRRLAPDTIIFLDVPAINPAAEALAKRHNMKRVFETARMYRMITKQSMDLPLEHWFSVTSFELG